ncbi:MAG: metallophosphoesterase [Oscillospiraceae bacterium]|nr:metallophosphoesterase [Oscillospiraceae bacterium]
MKAWKRKPFITVLLLLCGGLAFRTEAAAEVPEKPFRAVIASDLHYIAPELTDGGACYQRVLKNGDSKFMPYIEEITDAFLDEVLEERPDVVLLTGDLTFNGAELSHIRLCEKLRALTEAGIPVLVLPGNHDLYNVDAARFSDESFERVSFATTESFAGIYHEFGPAGALAVDTDSLSYVWPIHEHAWVMMLDENTLHDYCGLSAETLKWVETQLQAAQEKGCFVLVAGHQNLFQHSVFRDGYVIQRHDELAALLRKYEVPLCLSGHLHIQHIQSENGLTEITTSALCSYPCQYAVLTADEGRLRYETRRLNMKDWAERNDRREDVFSSFERAAGYYMDAHLSTKGMLPQTEDPILQAEMLDYLRLLNRAYFSGDLSRLPELDPDGRISALWVQEGNMVSAYVRSVLNEEGTNHNSWEISLP